MADSVTEQDNEVTDQELDSEDSEDKQVSNKDRQKRIQELKAELAELEGDGELEGATDPDLERIADEVEDAASDVANQAETETEVKDGASEAADDIAEDLKAEGITLSQTQIDGLAAKIAEAVYQKGIAQQKSKPRERQPDRRPKPTHISERRLFGKKEKS